jgi:hypothetical protein
MAITAATGSAISFGRVNKVFTNNDPGAAGNAPAGGQNIRLSAVLGADSTYGTPQAAGTQISFALRFWGKSGPYG